jgi:hypothetical protein
MPEPPQSAHPVSVTFQWKNIDDLTAEYRELQYIYSCNPLAKKIRDFVKRKSWNITNAVIIGLGSLTKRARPECCRWSLYQLIMFMDVIACLPDNGNMAIDAQDPAFTFLDEAFLRALGVTVNDRKTEGATDYGKMLGPHTFLFMHDCAPASVFLNATEVQLHIGRIWGSAGERLEWLADYFQADKAWVGERREVHPTDADVEREQKAREVIEKYTMERRTTVLAEVGAFTPCRLAFGGLIAYYGEGVVMDTHESGKRTDT